MQEKRGLLLRRALVFAALGVFALATTTRCGNSTIGNTGGDGGQNGQLDGLGFGDTGQPRPDAGPPKPCVPACKAPQTCSHTGVCINPGTCLHDNDCPPARVCDLATKKCVVKDQCGAQEIVADAVPPNMLISLDRSCSMRRRIGKAKASKWQIAVDALNKLLTKNAGKIRFGLALFPDTAKPSCGQSAIAVPVAAGNEAKIKALLTAALNRSNKNFPDGPCVTNIDTAMQQAATAPFVNDKTRENFVLLITDGKQAGCNSAGGDKGTTKIIGNLLKSKKVATFVVGFGSGVDPAQLNIFAAAGGKPAGPTTKFYQAENQASLDQALNAIAKKTLGCVYTLQQVPPTLDKIYVFFDNKEVAQDKTHKGGWDYDPKTNTVTFHGKACTDLKANTVKDLDIVYGCRKPTPDDAGGPGKDAGAKCAPGVTPCAIPENCPNPKTMTCQNGCCKSKVN